MCINYALLGIYLCQSNRSIMDLIVHAMIFSHTPLNQFILVGLID